MGDVRVSDELARARATIELARRFARYLQSWTDEHDHEVTAHEIASMRRAGRELLAFLDTESSGSPRYEIEIGSNVTSDEMARFVKNWVRRGGASGMPA